MTERPDPGSLRTTAPERRFARSGGPEAAARVVFSADPDAAGRALPLDGSVWTLGRAADEPLGRFEDARLSRFHCRLSPTETGYRLEDLRSRNGCRVDGVRVDQARLVPGAVIRIGDTLLAIDSSEPADRIPAAADADPDVAHDFVGCSYVAERVRRAVATIATADGPVLLLGPSGSGKEVVARAVHRLSGRKGAFVAVNCAAIAPELAESELFGHKRGAFTGADADRAGLFVDADGGSLFLDEIGEMARGLQAKLLRTIEDGIVRPVGSGRTRQVDVRIVAATNADVHGDGFRSDLRARLAEWPIALPPLAERRADVLPLFDHLLTRSGGDDRPVTPELAEALLLYDWPLNVRELDKVVRRMLRLAGNAEALDVDLLPPEIQLPVVDRHSVPAAADMPSRRDLEAALAEVRGNVAQLATRYDRDRKQVYRWMRRYGLDPADYR